MREPLPRSPDEIAEDEYWTHLYGPWEALDLDGAIGFFEGFDRQWWLVGGWAIEAFTAAPREHEDIDVSVLACDVPALREFVGDRWHLWSLVEGRIAPLTRVRPDLPAPDAQIWVRRHARAPWVMDLPVTPDADGLWQNKKDHDHVAPLDEVTWLTNEGVRVLNPEIVLMFKARLDRLKDRRDLARTLPLLGGEQRRWLHDVVRRLFPEHPWLPELAELPPDPAQSPG
ncbi:nucleotidyltransferase domain-containing protein [Nocardioides cynanchi]|uniref:nucleotidyltransferase domain-containing protein n=1 Tax=Nocardioides cynanchi TaxID=2558918 RepID=UPI001246A6E0|nr:hypothetical protein [Nocardioides cynanchi]